MTHRTDLTALSDAVERVRAQMGQFIVGQSKMVDLLLAALLADGHVLIEGVPGVAKTLAAKLLARSISAKFNRIQFTPDLMPSDVLGTSVFSARSNEFEFRQGPVFCNMLLTDEINRAPAKTQSALFEVMEERQVTMDGKTYPMTAPYMVLATQNPIEQEGTYRLPEAQLDRFLFKIEVSYPNPDEEVRILREFHGRSGQNDLAQVQPVLSAEEVQQYQQAVRGLHIDDNLLRYIADIVTLTRNTRELYLGGSPRASIALMTASKAIAALNGRDFVTPEDIRYVTEPVLQHRVILTPEKEMEGATAAEVIRYLVEQVAVPR